MNDLRKAAGWGSDAAIRKAFYEQYSNYNDSESQALRRKPGYVSELINYPIANPVLVAQSWNGANLIRSRYHGMCLLCDAEPSLYDFSMLSKREVWVLRHPLDINNGVELGRFIKAANASEVFVVTLGGGYDQR